MTGGWRATLRVAAAASARPTASAPRETPAVRTYVVAQDQTPHAFGPAPIAAPAHGIGFRSSRQAAPAAETTVVGHGTQAAESEHPVVETLIGPDPTPMAEDREEAPRPRHAADPAAEVEEVAGDVEVELALEQPSVRPGRHRREQSAISGTVRSTRGRGLRGMQVEVLDEAWQVVATAVTGTGGAFVAEDLAPGTYRVTAIDHIDGEFGAGWHAGTSVPRAGVLRVKEGRTRRGVDITLASNAEVKVDVDIRRTKAVLSIRVVEQATGVRAKGSVRVTTKRFSAELPLTRGRTTVSLLGSSDGSPKLSKKVTVDYLGTKHVLPGSASARLR
ncbi:carboxypeptidase-like regulatory domain-containing protein [Aeromicrobium sp.]|uniref:carboxypeptidase-like regulatory domain-containing protein n=1 Tax=Aeromicrobium sp. TaxID=1871063 RepID=UPI002FCAEE00